MSETQAIAHINNTHLKDLTDGMSISCEDMEEVEWKWSKRQTREFIQLWKRSVPLVEMSEVLERSHLDCLFKSFDLIYKEKISPRNWKIW